MSSEVARLAPILMLSECRRCLLQFQGGLSHAAGAIGQACSEPSERSCEVLQVWLLYSDMQPLLCPLLCGCFSRICAPKTPPGVMGTLTAVAAEMVFLLRQDNAQSLRGVY